MQGNEVLTDVNDDPRVNDLGGHLPDLFYIDGVAYEIESWGEPQDDGSRTATLTVWKPF